MKRIGIDVRKIDDFGIGTYIARLLERFAVASAPYEVVLFGDVARLRERFGPRFELVALNARKYSLGEQMELPRSIRRNRIDLFHSPHYVVPVLSRCPLVVTVHDLIHLRTDLRPGMKNRLVSLYARALIGRAVRQARRVVVPSRAVQRDIESRLPAARGKMAVIGRGADAALAAHIDPALVERFRGEHGLGRPLLLFVGNPAPNKNLPAVLGTLAELRRRGRPVQLAAVGGKPEVVQAEARACGVEGAVRVLGYVPARQLPLVYRAADVLLFPSLAEGFGLPALEAMTAGLAVVASNVSSLPEVVGDAAITVDPHDVSGLADAVCRVLDEPGLRARLIKRGRERAAHFTWRTFAEAHLKVYDEALDGG